LYGLKRIGVSSSFAKGTKAHDCYFFIVPRHVRVNVEFYEWNIVYRLVQTE
jgi:hypothetical protein